MHKKSFLIRDILTQMNSDSKTALESARETLQSSVSTCKRDQLVFHRRPDNVSITCNQINAIKSTIEASNQLQSASTSLFVQNSIPFVFNPPLVTSLLYPNVLPTLSCTWQSIATAAAAFASESAKITSSSSSSSSASSSFASFAQQQAQQQLEQLISGDFLCEFSSNTSSLSDPDSGCSSPLSMCSPDSPTLDVPTSGLNDCNNQSIVKFDSSCTPTSGLLSGTNVKSSRKSRKSKGDHNRRNRTVFTELQLMGLERRFDSQKYLSTPDRAELARALGLTQLQVKTWYQNRRMKWKKQVMQGGCLVAPTKPKGRPKKNSIPTFGLTFDTAQLIAAAAAAGLNPSAKAGSSSSRLTNNHVHTPSASSHSVNHNDLNPNNAIADI